MGFDENIEMVRIAFYQVLISSGPFLGAALAIGLIIGIIQAATSIQKMTLSFVPKVVLVIFAMGFLANFFLVSLTDYFEFIFETIHGNKMNFIPLPFYAPMDPLTGIELSTLLDYLFAFF